MKFLLLLLWPLGTAEVRFWRYYVKAKHPAALDKQGYLVTSSLDPVSYRAYHAGPNALAIDLLQTWVCKGHTGLLRPPCAPPEAPRDTPGSD